VDIAGTENLGIYANTIWSALNENNRVSLYARAYNIATGEATEVIINKLELL
jgi:hypothetical protein